MNLILSCESKTLSYIYVENRFIKMQRRMLFFILLVALSYHHYGALMYYGAQNTNQNNKQENKEFAIVIDIIPPISNTIL